MSNKTSDKNVGSIEDDVRILFNLKLYLESLLASGQDKLFYNDLLYDEKTIDCINAIEDLVKERKKYTIQLTDEQYRKVIENAQMDTSNDTVVAHRFAVMQQQINEKDKRIQELEEELAKYKDIDYMFKIDSNENRVDMKKIYFEWLEYKNKIQKLEEESEILEFQNKQVENYAEELKKYNKTVSDRIVEYKKNSIPTQVVTDLIQEYKDKIERYDEYRIQGKETDVEYYENIANTAIVQVLQELLEGEK